MTKEFRQVPIPMSMFNDDELSALFVASTLWHSRGYEAISILVGCMLQSEGDRRQHNLSHPESIVDPGFGCIRPSDWSDADVASALVFCWGFSADTRNPKLGELVDSLGGVFVEIASERLQSSGDPRNARSFEDRNRPQQEGNPDANAEAN